jgi:hypothetical protein
MPFISNLKKPACASKQDVFELGTSRYTYSNIIKRLSHLSQKVIPNLNSATFLSPLCVCIFFIIFIISQGRYRHFFLYHWVLDSFQAYLENREKKIMRCWKKKPINQSDSHKIVCFTKISMFYISFEGLKLPSGGKKGGKGFNALRIILNNSFQFCLITYLYIEHQSSTVGRIYAGKRISERNKVVVTVYLFGQ